MMTEILQVLDAEVAGFPDRASGEQLYEHINKIAARYTESERMALIAALSNWLQLRSEPKTMIAVDVSGRLCLSELRTEIENLLTDIEQRKAFLPFYAKPIKKVLSMI